MKKKYIIVGLIGLLSGCSIDSNPKPFIYGLSPNMNLYLEPKKNISFDIGDKSEDRDIVSFEAYLKQETKNEKINANLRASRLDLEMAGVAMAQWDIASQYNEIPEGKVDFILEMTDKSGKKGKYTLPINIKKK